MNISDRMSYLLAGVASGRLHEVERRAKGDAVDGVLMIVWQSSGTLLSVEEAAGDYASTVLSGSGFRNFHPHARGTLVRYERIQRNGATLWSHRRCSAIQAR